MQGRSGRRQHARRHGDLDERTSIAARLGLAEGLRRASKNEGPKTAWLAPSGCCKLQFIAEPTTLLLLRDSHATANPL
jgi:hypothetical protein